jgi:hypothetical protein
MLGVGSILFFANKHSHVWGSGILHPGMSLSDIDKSTFHALRGKRTFSFLTERGISLPDLPLGDPGIFAKEVCEIIPAKDRDIRFRAAFVPHHNSTNNPLYRSVGACPEFVVVDILNDTLLPLQQILQSEVVISQSLHGLIYAESLGKPNLWISDRQDAIWRFKFDDWYSTTAMPQHAPHSLAAPVEELIGNASLRESTINKQDLARSLPVTSCTKLSGTFTDFRSCRRYNPVVLFTDTLFSGRSYSEDEFGSELLERLAKKIFPMVYKLFRHWAERSYCMVVPVDEQFNMDPDRIASAVRFLDENSGVDFAFIAPRDTLGGIATGGRVGPVGARKVEPKLAAGCILLRPDSYQLSRNFVTLSI